METTAPTFRLIPLQPPPDWLPADLAARVHQFIETANALNADRASLEADAAALTVLVLEDPEAALAARVKIQKRQRALAVAEVKHAAERPALAADIGAAGKARAGELNVRWKGRAEAVLAAVKALKVGTPGLEKDAMNADRELGELDRLRYQAQQHASGYAVREDEAAHAAAAKAWLLELVAL